MAKPSTITQWLQQPSKFTDEDRKIAAGLLKQYPYFVPARMMEAAEQQKKVPYAPAMLSTMQLYRGNWILFCNFMEDASGNIKPIPKPEKKQSAMDVLNEKEDLMVAQSYEDEMDIDEDPNPLDALSETEENEKDEELTDELLYGFNAETELDETDLDHDALTADTEQAFQEESIEEEEEERPFGYLEMEGAEETLHSSETQAPRALQQGRNVPQEAPAPDNLTQDAQQDELQNEEPAIDLKAEKEYSESTAEPSIQNEGFEEEATHKIPVQAATPLEEFEAPTEEKTIPFPAYHAPEKTSGIQKEDSLIQPIFTEDYFLHQGIQISDKVAPETTENNDPAKSLMVVMSFSEWLNHFKTKDQKTREEQEDQRALKTMWQKEKLAAAMEEENEEIPEEVFEMAVNSITQEEGLASEPLANILVKQGKNEKAIEMLRKLSLRNPHKSAYFAQKIDEIIKGK